MKYEVRNTETNMVYSESKSFARAMEHADILRVATHENFYVVECKTMYDTRESNYKLRPIPEMACAVFSAVKSPLGL